MTDGNTDKTGGNSVTGQVGIRIGFRIEFWDRPDAEEKGKLVGDAYCEDAYQAAALPRPGELVATQIISGYSPGRDHHGTLALQYLPVPFLRVAAVEHYPALLDAAVPGGMPPGGPGAQIVFRLKAPDSTVARDNLGRQLTRMGWTVGWQDDFDTLGQ